MVFLFTAEEKEPLSSTSRSRLCWQGPVLLWALNVLTHAALVANARQSLNVFIAGVLVVCASLGSARLPSLALLLDTLPAS